MAVAAGGRRLITIGAEKKVHLLTMATGEAHWITEIDSVVSLAVAGRCMLLNLACQDIHLYDLGADGLGCPTAPTMRYRGITERRGRFVIRSGFGGAQQAFVVSGSEDSQIYIWHRTQGALLSVLPGHSGARTRPSARLAAARSAAALCSASRVRLPHRVLGAGAVNAVAWNPTNPGLLASASDDHMVRLWASDMLLASLPAPPPRAALGEAAEAEEGGEQPAVRG